MIRFQPTPGECHHCNQKFWHSQNHHPPANFDAGTQSRRHYILSFRMLMFDAASGVNGDCSSVWAVVQESSHEREVGVGKKLSFLRISPFYNDNGRRYGTTNAKESRTNTHRRACENTCRCQSHLSLASTLSTDHRRSERPRYRSLAIDCSTHEQWRQHTRLSVCHHHRLDGRNGDCESRSENRHRSQRCDQC